MPRRSRTAPRYVGIALCVVTVAWACEARGQETTDDAAAAAFSLTRAEVDRAREIAERSIVSSALRAEGPLYHVGSELELAKRAGTETPARLAYVVHYRYAGDLRIETVVDLASGRVVRQEATPHQPTRLAAEEVRRVSELVLAQPRVREAVGRQITATEVIPMVFSPPPGTPLFGKRAVLVQLRQGDRFLNLPFVVYVDLTGSQVILEDRAPDAASH